MATDAHIDVHADGEWRQGLLIEQLREPGQNWRFHVAYLLSERAGVNVVAEWVDATRVRTRRDPRA